VTRWQRALREVETEDEENRAANRCQQQIIEPIMQIAGAVFMARNLTMNAAKSKGARAGR
jgi:hypothetical protein